MDLVAAAVFITCHSGPSGHFATFIEALPKTVHTQVYAAGPALKAFQDRNIFFTPFDLTDAKAAAIALKILEGCPHGSTPVAIIDIGHPFATKIAKALADRNITCLAYYDNPEPYVPGGYSKEAHQTMVIAKGIIFANANLAKERIFHEPGQEMDLSAKRRIGLGYSPIIEKASALNIRRETEQSSLRKKLLPPDFKDKKIVVYFGGNNNEYFGNGKENEGAFPAFLRLLSESIQSSDLSHLAFVIQQHPGAKPKEFENNLIAAWEKQHRQNPYAPKFSISSFGSDDAQVIADGIMYYQTSMNAQFSLLEGIVTVQVAHETFEDCLIRIGFPSVTNAAELQNVIRSWDTLVADQASKKEEVLASLGSNPEWAHTLKGIFRNPASFLQEQPGSK